MKKAKTFDCVEMQDQAALRIYEETKGMSLDEQYAYWQGQREKRLEEERRIGKNATSPDEAD